MTFTSDDVAGLPDGRHAVVFDTADSVAVDRRRAGDHPHDRRHPDDVGAARRRRPGRRTPSSRPRGRSAIGPGEPTEDALVVYNSDEPCDATVTVQAVTADGRRRTCRAWTSVALPAAS